MFKDDSLEISNFLLDHTIDCSGFLFRELSSKRKIIKDKILIVDQVVIGAGYMPMQLDFLIMVMFKGLKSGLKTKVISTVINGI